MKGVGLERGKTCTSRTGGGGLAILERGKLHFWNDRGKGDQAEKKAAVPQKHIFSVFSNNADRRGGGKSYQP